MSLFSRHTTNYSMVHIPPYWETGLVGWQSVMMHRKREVQGILWWLLPCRRLEKPIVVNIRCFDLPSIYSLFSGKRVSTFAENPSRTLSPHNGSGLIPLPIAGLGRSVGSLLG